MRKVRIGLMSMLTVALVVGGVGAGAATADDSAPQGLPCCKVIT